MSSGKDESFPLEVVSNEDRLRHVERRRLTRLGVSSEQFRFSQNGKLISIADLSQTGMGFWLSSKEDLACFSVGMLIEGILNLNGEKLDLKARVKNVRSDRVGAEFENLSEHSQ